jgi:hypothetical protein
MNNKQDVSKKPRSPLLTGLLGFFALVFQHNRGVLDEVYGR